jgi:thymidylate synthase
MKQYIDLCKKILSEGEWVDNRTSERALTINGYMMQYDLSDGFPAVTTKKLAFKSVVAEMLGFLRGYNNTHDFEKLGCKVWTDNAYSDYWLNNDNNTGGDGYLGRIYGVQARSWNGEIDQLKVVVDKLLAGNSDRRMIVSHWNPSELDSMALPPCHLLYQFNVIGDKLNLTMYQRSADVPLGVPFNIAGYSWLLSVISKITGLTAGTLTHFLNDCHIYENQLELVKTQVERDPLSLPELVISDNVDSLEYLETNAVVDDFTLTGYNHHPHIKYPFTV